MTASDQFDLSGKIAVGISAALYPASNAASCATGAILQVDGSDLIGVRFLASHPRSHMGDNR